jgi:predicted Zn-dependent protease with MMP-like domain
VHLHRSFQLWRRLARAEALDVHFDLGLRAFDERDLPRLRQNLVAVSMLPEGGLGSIEYLALSWRLAWLENRGDDALDAARAVVRRFPEDPDGVLELAQILTDLKRLDEAREVLQDGVQKRPDDADLWFELGIVAERLDLEDLRLEAFLVVWRLEHEDEPDYEPWLDDQAMAAVVERTIASMPDAVRGAIGNVSIIIDNYPEQWVVAEGIADPRILGLFDGPILADEQSTDAVLDGPARIYLYRRNIERTCRDAEEAQEQVEITTRHEIGHYLGLDEDALDFMGLG